MDYNNTSLQISDEIIEISDDNTEEDELHKILNRV